MKLIFVATRNLLLTYFYFRIILYLSDAHDKAKELFDYFKKTVTDYI